MKVDDIVLQIFLWIIVFISVFIAHEFYKSKDGRLRVLVIRLFLAKIFVYGGAAIAIIWGINTPLVKIGLNLPMLLVMLQLYAFIRRKK